MSIPIVGTGYRVEEGSACSQQTVCLPASIGWFGGEKLQEDTANTSAWGNRFDWLQQPVRVMPLPQSRVPQVEPMLLLLARMLMKEHRLRVSPCRYFSACVQ